MEARGAIDGAERRLLSHPEAVHGATHEATVPTLDVAVVVPSFRDARFLADCLESVRQQQYPHWRCYVVDDASPEDVGSIAHDFARRDERFVVCRHGANGGLSSSRNTGLILASEALVQFLDADDMLTPWALESRVEVMRANWSDTTVAGAYGHVAQCTDETRLPELRTWTRRRPSKIVDWLTSDAECPFNAHAPLVRRALVEAVGGFDERFRNGAEDWDLWHRLLRHGYAFMPTSSIVGAYRQRRNSMIRSFSATHLERADQLISLAEQWVKVDTALVVANAAMPLSVARESVQRSVRAARWAGIRAADSDDPTAGIDEQFVDFLGPVTPPATRTNEIVVAARGGLIRGLGLAPDLVPSLSPAAADRLQNSAELIAARILDLGRAHSGEPPADSAELMLRRTADVALIAETVADVATLVDAIGNRDAISVVAIDTAILTGDQGTTIGWSELDIETVSPNEWVLDRCSVAKIVAPLPHGPAIESLLDVARRRSVDIELINLPGARAPADIEPDTKPSPIPERLRRSAASATVALPSEEHVIDPDGCASLASLRNSRHGETAVIIGNGPSLNDTDLSLLEGVATFGVNSIFLAHDRLPEPLTYYVVEDQAVFRDNVERIKNYVAGTKFFPTDYRRFFDDHEVGPDGPVFFRMNRGFYGRGTGNLCHPRFSFDAAQRLFCGQSVTAINLQLAYWLGFTRVILVGMDFAYQIPDDTVRQGDVLISQSADPNHFDPTYFGAGKTWHDPKLDRVLLSFQLADRVYAATDREIINSTVGGELELFPRLPLERALAVTPPGRVRS